MAADRQGDLPPHCAVRSSEAVHKEADQGASKDEPGPGKEREIGPPGERAEIPLNRDRATNSKAGVIRTTGVSMAIATVAGSEQGNTRVLRVHAFRPRSRPWRWQVP